MRKITISGLPTRTNIDKIIMVIRCCGEVTNPICDPSMMKKITKKKSLSVFIFAVISNLIGENESVIPATSAHISIENQK